MQLGRHVLPGVVVLIHGDEQGEPVAPGARCSDLWDESCWVSSDLQLCLKVIALHILQAALWLQGHQPGMELLRVFCHFFIF